jgi:hypothetical protein
MERGRRKPNTAGRGGPRRGTTRNSAVRTPAGIRPARTKRVDRREATGDGQKRSLIGAMAPTPDQPVRRFAQIPRIAGAPFPSQGTTSPYRPVYAGFDDTPVKGRSPRMRPPYPVRLLNRRLRGAFPVRARVPRGKSRRARCRRLHQGRRCGRPRAGQTPPCKRMPSCPTAGGGRPQTLSLAAIDEGTCGGNSRSALLAVVGSRRCEQRRR